MFNVIQVQFFIGDVDKFDILDGIYKGNIVFDIFNVIYWVVIDDQFYCKGIVSVDLICYLFYF